MRSWCQFRSEYFDHGKGKEYVEEEHADTKIIGLHYIAIGQSKQLHESIHCGTVCAIIVSSVRIAARQPFGGRAERLDNFAAVPARRLLELHLHRFKLRAV